jgi:HD-like signal output (HDOD) protein/ActR/RegA family two-component response regulator
MQTILFVDDDPEIILSTRRLFFALRHEWQVTFASSGAEALQCLGGKAYEVIVSDIRMPGMSGIDLLEQVRRHYPHMVRIALSGHADREASLKASGLAHQYLAKPCSIDSIVAAIRQSMSIGHLVVDAQLRKLIAQLTTVPSQPEAYLQIIDEVKQPEPSIGRIGKIIAQDAGMAAKILQLVNSAFFGLPQTIISPEQAVVLLGLDTIRDLVLTVGVFSQFEVEKLSGVALADLWDHSQRTGGVAKAIALQQKANKKQVNDAFIAGLLHDIGKLILADNLPQQYRDITRRCALERKDLTRVERQTLGATHAHVAAYLFGLWGLSDSVVAAIAGHHEPSSSPTDDLPVMLAVHVANVIDYQAHPDRAQAGLPPQFDLAFIQAQGAEEQLDAWQQTAF